MDHIEFLGHVFSESGMHLSDERVQGIRQIPEQFIEGSQKLRRHVQLLPILYKWAIGSSDTLHDVSKEEMQL